MMSRRCRRYSIYVLVVISATTFIRQITSFVLVPSQSFSLVSYTLKTTPGRQVQHLWLQQKTHRYYAFSPEKTNHLPDNDDDDGHLWNSETRQILGLKNPAETTELWKIRLQLAKPISWVPLSVLVLCGAIASGHFQWNSNSDTMMMIDHALIRVIAAMILAGPCSEGFAQTINDWYDRDIDAINEPYRPIPAGKITPAQVWEQLLALFLVGIAIAVGLDATASASTLPEQGSSSNFPMVTAIAIVGYIISYLYSAPPVKLKQNGITGDLAICICYIAFPFWVGQAVFGGLQQPVDWLLPLTYSLVGIGAGICNDFKSMEGDKKFGLKSIPLMVGVDTAKTLAAVIPDIVQLGMAGFWYHVGEPLTAAVVASCLLPQIYFQSTLLWKDPLGNDQKYVAISQPFLVLGILASSLTMGNHDWRGFLQ